MTDQPQAIMLFAAGFGTRMGALTTTQPKPLIKVSGRALIDHTLQLVDEVRPDRTVINLHYRADQIEAHLAGRDISFAKEWPDILETGGGLRAALPLLGSDTVFTLNTDAIWAGPNPLALLRDQWDPTRMDALLMCIPVDQTVGHSGPGDFTRDADGRISRGPGLIYGGAQIIKTQGLHDIEQEAFSLNLLWDRMHDEKRLFAAEYPGRWCDVGRPEGIALAEGLIADV